MAVELDPGFWEWLRKKERRPNSNDTVNEPVSQPLYVEIPLPPKKPENDRNDNNDESGSQPIDFIIFE
jgi:hypothetical protein